MDSIFHLEEDAHIKEDAHSICSIEQEAEKIKPTDEPSLSSSLIVNIHNFAASDTVEGSFTKGQPEAVPMQRQMSSKHFELLSVIGQGAYGKVFLVRKRGAYSVKENIYAMKVLKKAHIVVHNKDAEHTRNERNILEAVRHPFIVKLFYAFQTSSKLYLILSFAPGGELFTYLANEKMFSETTTTFYTGELLLALEHLHSLGIIYRDLKPENVLLNGDGHVILTDFGLSKVALDTKTICGTPEFMAPEIIQEKTYDKTVDFWSLGVMIYDMLTGGPPFVGNNTRKIHDAILNKKLQCPNYMTSFAKDLCTRLLKKTPSQRLGKGPNGSTDIKKHSFYRKIDWIKLGKKECKPPIIPNLKSSEDTSNFSPTFTSLPLVDTPPHSAQGSTSLLAQQLRETQIGTPNIDVKKKSDTDLFKGFSYVNEEVE